MASYYAKDLADVALAYHRKFIINGKVIDLSPNFRNYSVWEDLQSPEYYDTGEKTFNYMLQVGGFSNYQRDALNNPESYTTGNLLIEAKTYWAMVKTGWAIDERQPGFKKGASASEIVSIHDTYRRNMWNDFLQNEEIAKWTLAAYPNTSNIRVNGVPNYVVKASSAAPGRVTSHPSGYSSVDNVSRSTYPQASNYGCTYTANDMLQLDTRMNKLFWLMGWQSPKKFGATEEPMSTYKIYTTFDVLQQYRQLLRASNSDIGMDFGKYYGPVRGDGSVNFQGVPMYAIDALTSSTLRDGTSNPAYDSTNPVYMLDTSTWKMYAGKGEFLREDAPHKKDNPKRMVSFDMFSMHGRVCVNPSANAVLHAA